MTLSLRAFVHARRVFPSALGAVIIALGYGIFPALIEGDRPCLFAEESAPSKEALDFFEAKIRPVLVDHCYECHSSKSADIKGGLLVDSREGLLEGGDSGPAVVPGDPNRSLVIQAIRYGEDSYQMPPKGKLPAEVIADFESWISSGAADPREKQPLQPPPPSPAKTHWAFQPLKASARRTMQGAWAANTIDAAALSGMESQGLAPAAQADRRTLLRRLSFDLTGLPPSFEEVESFVADDDPLAYEKRVDRLLGSPTFGERWARHWMDVSRFADTKGYVFMEERFYASAYRYRDWVVKSFNGDLPFPDFVKLQLAADRLAPDDPDSLAAMGFLTLGRRFINNKHDIIDDRIDVVTRGLLGLTVTCARCHDHKYDPVPMEDYYSLYGVFASSRELKDDPAALHLVDVETPRNARVFLRGNPSNPGDETPRRFLEALSGENRQPFTIGSGRLELAEAIVRADNPLTARVFVNRVWSHLFGKGLTPTPSDFGLRSDPPRNPELLDELARTLIDSGWSVKELVRAIVLSSTYRQSSQAAAETLSADPENWLAARANRRRLDFEAMRDAMLAVAEGLDRTIGGPSVKITEGKGSPRRSVYAYIDRQNLPGVFRSFDFASPDTHAPQRFETTTPQQALFLMNNDFALQQATQIASSLGSDPLAAAQTSSQDLGAATATATEVYRRVLGRDPSSEEAAQATAFLVAEQTADQPTGAAPAAELPPAARLAHVLLLSNEFMILD